MYIIGKAMRLQCFSNYYVVFYLGRFDLFQVPHFRPCVRKACLHTRTYHISHITYNFQFLLSHSTHPVIVTISQYQVFYDLLANLTSPNVNNQLVNITFVFTNQDTETHKSGAIQMFDNLFDLPQNSLRDYCQ